MPNLKITQIKSPIGGTHNQRAPLHSLGLRKISQTVVRTDDDVTKGMVNMVRHLVVVTETDEEVNRHASA
jgi:large subunit ribosomal protein L30